MENNVLKTNSIQSRPISFLIVLLIYIIAFFTGFFIIKILNSLGFNLLISFFIADITATIIVWLSGLAFKNSSVYDPYWSVAPFVIILSWIILRNSGFFIIDILFLAAVFVWGTRLTLNWALKWRGMADQDWRYGMLREKSPKMWFLTNLVGINLVPTLVVYLALIPAYFAIMYNSMAMENAGGNLPALIQLNPVIIAGFIICIASTVMQAVSDRQMDSFRKLSRHGRGHINQGLWRYSRHPNYFAEVFFWWGIWVMQMGAVNLKTAGSWLWMTIAGPVFMTLLFVFISIPMMEKHLVLKRPSYVDYKRKVSMLVPWFRFKE